MNAIARTLLGAFLPNRGGILNMDAYRWPMAPKVFFTMLGALTLFLLSGAIFAQWQGTLLQVGMNENANLHLIPGVDSMFFPLKKLYFPIFWVGYVVMAGLLRYFMYNILGDSVALQDSVSLSLISCIPLVVLLGISSFFMDLFPYVTNRSVAGVLIQIGFSILVLGVGLALDFIHIHQVGKQIYSQNFGRAFLVWLFPVGLLCVILFLGIFVFAQAYLSWNYNNSIRSFV